MSAARYTKISDFCETGSGTTPSRQKADRYYGGNIPWVKSGELREGEITKTEESVTDVALKETSLKLVPAGALLVAMYGATVGRVGRLGIEATTNQAVCHIVPDPTLADERYMFHALCAKASELVAKGVGGAQPNISQGTIKETTVYLPPLDEQKRIAAILDQADELRRKRQRATDRLNQLGQAIFHEMFLSTVGVPMKAIENFAEVKGGKRLPKGSDYESVPTSHAYIRVSDLNGVGIDIENLKYISNEVHQSVRRYTVSETDVIISIAGTIGVTATVPVALKGANLTENAAKITPKQGISFDPTYLAWALRTPESKSQILASTGQVTIGKLALFRIEKIVLPMPELIAQSRFSNIVAAIEHQHEEQMRAAASMEKLFSSIQNRAFQGEL